MGLVLEFDELESGAQVGIQSTDRGVISGHAVANGTGGSAAFRLVIVTDDIDWVFVGGTPGVNQKQIYPLTIIQCQTITDARTWKLSNTGAEDGWLVAMNIEGADPGAVEIRDNADILLAKVSVLFPDSVINALPFPVFYYDAGEEKWFLLRSRILIP